jgi:hypothetical protein
MKMAVEKAYPGKKWKQKVAQMSNEQITAVYFNLLNSKKLA